MATLNYLWPSNGGATPPTKEVMAEHSEVVVDVSVALYDTSVVITHNMQLTAAERATGFPEISLSPTSAVGETPFTSAKDANTVTITVAGTAGGTFRASIRRPNSRFK